MAIVACIVTGWLAYQGFNAARYIANDLQLFSRWDQQTVAADMAKIDSMILPAVEAYTRREGRLPASLGALVAAGDLASIPDSRAGVWMYKVRRDAFEIGVGDPPHEYPCAYRVIELDGPGNADPDLWTVRDWYHDT